MYEEFECSGRVQACAYAGGAQSEGQTISNHIVNNPSPRLFPTSCFGLRRLEMVAWTPDLELLGKLVKFVFRLLAVPEILVTITQRE